MNWGNPQFTVRKEFEIVEIIDVVRIEATSRAQVSSPSFVATPITDEVATLLVEGDLFGVPDAHVSNSVGAESPMTPQSAVVVSVVESHFITLLHVAERVAEEVVAGALGAMPKTTGGISLFVKREIRVEGAVYHTPSYTRFQVQIRTLRSSCPARKSNFWPPTSKVFVLPRSFLSSVFPLRVISTGTANSGSVNQTWPTRMTKT